MDTTQDEVDAEVGDDDTQEGQQAVEVECSRTLKEAAMKGDGIDDEGDERPHLLGVPRPVVAPRDIGPDGSDDDADGQKRHGWIQQNKVQLAEYCKNTKNY